jgi:hypothetical protein
VVGEVIDPLDEERKNAMAIDLIGTTMRSSDAIWPPTEMSRSFPGPPKRFSKRWNGECPKKEGIGDSVSVSAQPDSRAP